MSPALMRVVLCLTPPNEPGLAEDEREIVVTTGTQTEHSSADSPVQTDVVTRDELLRNGAESLQEVLEEEPGVRVTRGIGGAGIQLQGLDPKYTIVLIDGQRVTGRVGGRIDLSRIPVDSIEQVEIVRGAGSVLYGSDAVAGTVNVVTRRSHEDGKPVEADARFAYGSFNTLDATARVGLGRRRGHGSVHGAYRHTDGFDRDTSNETTTGSAGRQFNVGAAAGYVGRRGFRIDSTADYLRRDQLAINEQATGAIVDQRNLTETVQARLTPEFADEDDRLRVTVSYTLFKDQYLADQRGDDDLDQDQVTTDQVARVRGQYDLRAGKHVLTVGAEGQLEVLQAARLDPGSVDRRRLAVFVQDEWRPADSPTIAILPGLRVDYDSRFEAWVTPRLGAMVRPTESFTLRGSFGRSYRAPDFKEMFLAFDNAGVGYQVRGNPNLRPEDAWGLNLDATYEPWSFVTFQVLAFDVRLSDAIVTDTVSEGDAQSLTLFGYVNVGNAETRGLEGRARVRFRDYMELGGSYQALHTRDLSNDRPLPGRAAHSGAADLLLRHPHDRWETALKSRAAFFGEQVFFRDLDGDDVLDRDPVAPFVSLDLRLSQRLTRFAEIFVGVDNLLDAGNATTNPIAPRAFYGGVSGRY